MTGLAAMQAVACTAPHSKSVVVAYSSGTASLVPEAVASEELAASILSNVYEPLVSFEGNLALQPGLAESWYTEDKLTWVFKLRQGVRFHDGRPLDAASVVQSIERARTSPESKVRGELAAIDRVEVRDPGTVIVRTKVPFAAMPPRLESVEVWLPPRGDGTVPVGTGPYTVHAWTPRGDTVLDSFEGYARGPAAIKRLEFHIIPSLDDRLRHLQDGSADLVVDVPPERIASLEASRRVRILTLRGLRVIFLGMDCARDSSPYVSTPSNPFRDPKVRSAVALAIDRQALVRDALAGHGEVIDQLVAPGVFGFHPSLKPNSFDPAEARKLLAEAGFPHGFEVDLDFMPKKYLAMPRVVSALTDQLARVGIQLRPRPREAEDFFAHIEKQDSAFYLMGWIATSGDAGVSYEYLIHSPGGGMGSENGTGYSRSSVDTLLQRATAELSISERAHLLWDAAAAVNEDKPFIPLYRQEDIYAVNPALDFEPRLARLIRGVSMKWRPGPEDPHPR